MLSAAALGRRPAAGMPAAVVGAARARLRGAAAPALTSRNSLAALRALAARINPDLIASNEGGSNLTLVRAGGWRSAAQLELRPGPRPERRVMAFSRLALDARARALRRQPARERRAGAARGSRAGGGLGRRAGGRVGGAAPLLFGGDLNLRPPRLRPIYETLAGRFGLRPANRLPVRSTICSSAGLEIVARRRPGRPSGARSRPAASRSGSPTTRRSRRRSHEPPIARAYGAASGAG